MMEVVAAGVGDLAAVVALERRVAEAPHWAVGEYEAIVRGDGAVRRCLLVARRCGELVGFAVAKVVGDEAELESVAVRVEARRGGVGKALCVAVVEWAWGEGARGVELEVRASSMGAIALYEGLGFLGVGRRRGYYSEPVDDALLMRLKS